ncbi:MAG: protein of unknown function transrane [Clostridia bacterium]|jgi:drug/metabolite transporter (DMT)-like permease|nr:protein of unknown function transrane [Clostridia bacterium]
MKEHRLAAAHGSAIITIFIWGTTFIATKILLKDFTPIEILFFRFVIGYATLFVISPKVLKPKCWREEIHFAMAGLCGVTLYFLLENIALTYTFASNVGIIISIAPIFTALLAHLLLDGEKLEQRFFFGFIAAIMGISLVALNGSYVLRLSPMGDLLAILAALAWAFYSILMKKVSSFKYSTIQGTRKVFLYGLIFMIPALFIFDFRLNLVRLTSAGNLFNILYLGLGASALCFATWNWSVSLLGAVKTSVYIYLVPVVTIVTSALVLDEKITWMALLGAVLTLAGLYISQYTISVKAKEEMTL